MAFRDPETGRFTSEERYYERIQELAEKQEEAEARAIQEAAEAADAGDSAPLDALIDSLLSDEEPAEAPTGEAQEEPEAAEPGTWEDDDGYNDRDTPTRPEDATEDSDLGDLGEEDDGGEDEGDQEDDGMGGDEEPGEAGPSLEDERAGELDPGDLWDYFDSIPDAAEYAEFDSDDVYGDR